MAMGSISYISPNSSLAKLSSSSSSMALCQARPSSLGFESLSRAKFQSKVSIVAFSKGFSVNLQRRNAKNRSVFSFAAAHEESKPSDIDIEKEKKNLKVEAEESEEAWQQTLAAFKEQALKMQNVSKEAYDLYSAKAVIILKETSEKLKIQAEKARQDLSVVAKEIAEDSKEYLSTAAENSPEPVKDIIETFASPEDLHDVSKVQDFYVGIPYGALLSVGGFLSFMFTGSIPAIRFGIILGGSLLALSIASLRLWKKGESSSLNLKGQIAIATILFLHELRMWSTRPFIANLFTTLLSGGVLAFFLYRIIRDKGMSGTSNVKLATED